MATPKQPQGNVSANFRRILSHDNRYAQMSEFERAKNDRLPLFSGVISSPEDPEQKFEYAVWEYASKDGVPFYAGSVRPLSTRATVEQHLELHKLPAEVAQGLVDRETGEVRERGQYELTPNSIIIRANAKRLKTSDTAYAGLSDAEREENEKRPSFWLKWQRAAGEKEVRGSLWDKAGRYGPFLAGNTQYPLSRDEAMALRVQDEREVQPEPEEQVAQRKRGRGGR